MLIITSKHKSRGQHDTYGTELPTAVLKTHTTLILFFFRLHGHVELFEVEKITNNWIVTYTFINKVFFFILRCVLPARTLMALSILFPQSPYVTLRVNRLISEGLNVEL